MEQINSIKNPKWHFKKLFREIDDEEDGKRLRRMFCQLLRTFGSEYARGFGMA